MISIIIPVYNQTKELDKCLASIRKQTYSNYEIIIVNDRSTQKMSHVIKKYMQAFGYKFSLINNQSNHGAPYSRNKGFRKSHGEFLLFCDADVILKPEMLEVMYTTLKSNLEASYTYSSHRYGAKKFACFQFSAERLKQGPYIHSTSLIRREHLPPEGWDENIKRLQDWDLWLTMLEQGNKGVWINKILFRIQGGGHTMSSWLPILAYQLLPFLAKVRKYKQAVRIVKEKHGLT